MNPPTIAITLDDFEWDTQPNYIPFGERNRRLLNALNRHGVQAAVFVNGQYVDEGRGPDLLRTWDRAGHIIGNHTYSHKDFNDPRVTLKSFAADIRANEPFLQPCSHFRRLFRYPFLHEGDTREKRDGLRRWLTEHGYRFAPVTIPTCDWAIDDRLRLRLQQNPHLDLEPYQRFYRKHVADRVLFYRNLAQPLPVRSISHSLLLHYSLLNALFLGDVLEMLRVRGWKLVNAGEVFEDRHFQEMPSVYPSDGGYLWALARQYGKASGITLPDDSGKETIAQMDKLGL
jgi:hypothetical protein